MKDFWLSCGHHLLDRNSGRRTGGDRRIPEGLSRAARIGAAAGSLCGRERTLHAALDGGATPCRQRGRDRRHLPIPMRARTGK